MKLCVDVGHGMSNRTPGVFDPGACHEAFREADIVLTYAHALDAEARKHGIETYMTRTDNAMDAPLNRRVKNALEAGCTVLISIHCNASILVSARGTETLYGTAHKLASKVQENVVKATGLVDRGPKYRDDLAVLRFKNSALIELGFITNVHDLATMMQPGMPGLVATAICDAIQPEKDL